MRWWVRSTGWVAAASTATAAAYALALRGRQLRWGATAEETGMPLPGDDVLPAADLVATRAITIAAAADDVWPWLAQIGQGRGGFYSYDRLENLAGCRISSADRVVAEWQDVAVGDEVRLHPQVALRVVGVEPGAHLVVLGGAADAGTSDPGAPYDFTWSFVLLPAGPRRTRLVVRERYRYRTGWVGLVVEPLCAVSFVMTQRMLRGIRDRAQAQPASAANA